MFSASLFVTSLIRRERERFTALICSQKENKGHIFLSSLINMILEPLKFKRVKTNLFTLIANFVHQPD